MATPKPPTQLNSFRMPAEWEPHAATWLAWPHYKLDWPGKFEPIPWVYAETIRYLSRNERVEVIVKDAAAEKDARKILRRAHALNENVRFHRWPTNRVWTRDSGCAFVVPCGADTLVREPSGAKAQGSSEALSARLEAVPSRNSPLNVAAIKWRFNAWAKYPNWQRDNKIGSLMAGAAGAQEIQAKFANKELVLEGGSIDVNGRGTLITTEECLLSTTQQRNPPMDRMAYEQMFAEYFGVQTVIWLDEGITGDDTHGHVDDIARFVAPDTVITKIEPNAQHEDYSALQHNLGRLKAAHDQNGQRLNVIEIPLPRPVVFECRRLPASYANFYIANGVVLMPVFNDPNDRIALNTLAGVFPSREMVPIYSGDLIWG